ncbi:type II toxin-antitoxin system MqsA family antitoxin [bacterium]|nr:type II toxin-antitoxin system MqsA family antitoxin [bacterium]MBU1957895.1 type II toxin-antitoxin system MqsA family antitoxin [bacterium]
MESCSFCGNKNIKSVLTEYTYRQNGNYMVFHNVPLQQCEFCGEKYFESKVLKQIEKEFLAVRNGKKVTEEIRVPVEDFSRLDVA